MAVLEKVIKGLEEWINDDNALDTKIDACLVADALELLKEQQWIPVTDRLPQDDEDVLVWVDGTHRDMAYRDEGVWYDEEHNHLKNITHWMPLPKPPKGGEQCGS